MQLLNVRFRPIADIRILPKRTLKVSSELKTQFVDILAVAPFMTQPECEVQEAARGVRSTELRFESLAEAN